MDRDPKLLRPVALLLLATAIASSGFFLVMLSYLRPAAARWAVPAALILIPAGGSLSVSVVYYELLRK